MMRGRARREDAKAQSIHPSMPAFDGERHAARPQTGTAHARPRADPRPPQPARHTAGMAARVTSSRLVGRSDELAELDDAFAGAESGSPSLALVAGDSGVGKTRLLSALAARVGERGGQALTGECVDLSEGELPYAPLLTAFRPLTRAEHPAVAALPAATRAELGALMPALGGGGAAPGGGQGRLFEAALALLRELGEREPLLLVLEDIHWADSSTRSFLAFLAGALRDERLLVVASYRLDELHRRHRLAPLLAELGRDARVRRVEVAPLTRAELAAALADILGAEPAAEEVERLYARSEGNALFMEELLAAGRDGRGGLPPTLRDAFMLRIERLPDAAQELLRVLAVGGRLDHDVLADATGMDGRELRESLRAAVANHLVVVDSDGAHAFRHALLREVVQDDLLPGEGIELHRALAAAYERRAAAGDVSLAVSAALASHQMAAGDAPAALAASVRAASAAEAARAPAEAAALLERALELWSRVPDAAAVAGESEVSLLWRAAEAHNVGGERVRAEALLQRALDRVDPAAEPRRAAAMLARLARFQWHLNHAAEAMASIRAGLELVPADQDSPERASLVAMWARAEMFQGRRRQAIARAREAQAAAEACGDGASLGVALNVLGTSLIPTGEAAEGIAALRRAAEIAAERDDPLELDAAVCNLAEALHGQGRSLEATAVIRRGAEQLFASPGKHQWLQVMRGEIAFDLGDWVEAARGVPERRGRLDDRTHSLHRVAPALPRARPGRRRRGGGGAGRSAPARQRLHRAAVPGADRRARGGAAAPARRPRCGARCDRGNAAAFQPRRRGCGPRCARRRRGGRRRGRPRGARARPRHQRRRAAAPARRARRSCARGRGRRRAD